jgi:hypothetical protein
VISFDVLWLDLFWRHAEQPAGAAVFEPPERAVRPDLCVTNAMADVPTFRPPTDIAKALKVGPGVGVSGAGGRRLKSRPMTVGTKCAWRWVGVGHPCEFPWPIIPERRLGPLHRWRRSGLLPVWQSSHSACLLVQALPRGSCRLREFCSRRVIAGLAPDRNEI